MSGIMGTKCPRCNKINKGGSYDGRNQVCSDCGCQYNQKVGYYPHVKKDKDELDESEIHKRLVNLLDKYLAEYTRKQERLKKLEMDILVIKCDEHINIMKEKKLKILEMEREQLYESVIKLCRKIEGIEKSIDALKIVI